MKKKDDFDVARGLINSIILALILWVLIGLLIWLIFF